MGTTCGIKHQNDDTRSRCHNPECRRVAAARGSVTPRTDKPRPAAPPMSADHMTVVDANGKPFVIDRKRPRVENRLISPDTAASLPDGTVFDSCTFRPGQYSLTDATLTKCNTPKGSLVAMTGVGTVSESALGGDVILAGETFSRGNAYHGHVMLADDCVVSHDYFAQPFTFAEIGSPTVMRDTLAFGLAADADQDGEMDAPPERQKRQSWLADSAKRVGSEVAMALVRDLMPGRRGVRRGRRR